MRLAFPNLCFLLLTVLPSTPASSAPERFLEECTLDSIPGIGYLGLGYNIGKEMIQTVDFFRLFTNSFCLPLQVTGDPRGSDSSELDPGYRGRVVSFEGDITTTVDKAFCVPKGVEVKSAKLCTFDSESIEISTAEQYKSELDKEVSWNIGKQMVLLIMDFQF